MYMHVHTYICTHVGMHICMFIQYVTMLAVYVASHTYMNSDPMFHLHLLAIQHADKYIIMHVAM